MKVPSYTTQICAAIVIPITGLTFLTPSANAANILLNGSFEDPVVSLPGNNSISATNWTLASIPTAFDNIILPFVGYSNGPDVAQEGGQYYDIGNGSGYISQTFTLASASTINFGAYFSIRVSGNTTTGNVDIFDATNMTLVTSSPLVVIFSTDSQEDWFQTDATSGVLAAGTYFFRLNMADDTNADNAYVIPTPVPETTSATLAAIAGLVSVSTRRRR